MSEQIPNERATPSRARWFMSGFGTAVAFLIAGLYLGGYFAPAIADEPGSTIIEAQ